MASHSLDDGGKHAGNEFENCEDAAASLQQAESAARCQLPHSDSGICLTPQSQTSVLSPNQPSATEGGVPKEGNGGVNERPPTVTIVRATPSPDQPLSSPYYEELAARNLQSSDVTNRDSGSSIVSPRGASQSARRGKFSNVAQSPADDFNCQTKYFVLQFFRQMTNEKNLPYLSQNSVSTTSESEPRFTTSSRRLYLERQTRRHQSSPSSPQTPRKKPLGKLKGSKSSPDLKDAKFLENLPKPKKVRAKKPQPLRMSKKQKSPSRSPVEAAMDAGLLRSVSETTDNSATGTYISDADDELNTSFDSSLQGSATSHSFRNKVVKFHNQALDNLSSSEQRLTEPITEIPIAVAEESTEDAGPAMFLSDLNVNNLEQFTIPPVTQQTRVNDYLFQMNDPLISYDCSAADVTDTTLQNVDDFDDVDSPPFHMLSHPDQAALHSGQLPPPEPSEEGAVSAGFDVHDMSDVLPEETEGNAHDTNNVTAEETEGACGGFDVTGAAGGAGDGDPRADRSRLTLNLHHQEADLRALHILREEISEEISSLESEFEEALQHMNSDLTSPCSMVRPTSPDIAEIAHKLALIGDDVQHKYFDQVDKAVARLFLNNCAGLLTYENFREAAMIALDQDLHGWKQVATVMLYSQHVALRLVQSGRRYLHRVVDYTVKLLADTAADFIIQQGGWGSISSIEIDSSSSDEANPLSSPLPVSGSGNTPSTTSSTYVQGSPSGHRNSSTSHLEATSSEFGRAISDSTDHIDMNAGFTLGREREPTAGSVPPSNEVTSPSSLLSGQDDVSRGKEPDKDNGEKAEGESNNAEGGVSARGSAVATPAVLTGCALSVAVIAVGAALAVRLIRS